MWRSSLPLPGASGQPCWEDNQNGNRDTLWASVVGGADLRQEARAGRGWRWAGKPRRWGVVKQQGCAPQPVSEPGPAEARLGANSERAGHVLSSASWFMVSLWELSRPLGKTLHQGISEEIGQEPEGDCEPAGHWTGPGGPCLPLWNAAISSTRQGQVCYMFRAYFVWQSVVTLNRTLFLKSTFNVM